MPNPETSGLALPPVRPVPVTRPLRWLVLGWRDFTRAPLPSALHGLLLALVGLAALGLARRHVWLLSGAFSGFVLVAPILVTGLYELSRRLGRGETPTFSDVVGAWRRSSGSLLGFGLALMVAGTFWVAISAVLIALFVQQPVTGFESFIRYVVLSQDSNLFFVWIGLGGLVAALVFAASVVSVPLLLDRDVDMATALSTSIQAVSVNPICMAWWATLIMVATVLGMLTLLIGFVLIIPVLGHASWHAYVDIVDASALPARE